MTNFYNLYEFMNMVSYYIEHQGTEHLSLKGVEFYIHTLKYTFPCHMSARKEELRDRRLYGTGGEWLNHGGGSCLGPGPDYY